MISQNCASNVLSMVVMPFFSRSCCYFHHSKCCARWSTSELPYADLQVMCRKRKIKFVKVLSSQALSAGATWQDSYL